MTDSAGLMETKTTGESGFRGNGGSVGRSVNLTSSGDIKAGISMHSTSPSFNLGNSNETSFPAIDAPELEGLTRDNTMDGLYGFFASDSFVARVGLRSPVSRNPYYAVNPSFREKLESSLWYRFALKPNIGWFGFTLGVFGSTNKWLSGLPFTKDSVTENDGFRPDTFGMDAQLRGKLGDVTLGLKAVYLSGIDMDRSGSTITSPVLTNGFRAEAQLGISKSFGLSAIYRTYQPASVSMDNENIVEKAATIGAWINLSENIVIQPQYTTYGGYGQVISEGEEFSLRLLTGF